MGITTTFVALLYEPYRLRLPEVGESIAQNDSFGEIEGYKTTADIITPVTGKVVGRNELLVLQGNQGQGGYITAITLDPYMAGWMVVVRLDKPGELEDLMTPEGYIHRLGH
jgi:glycine cleavage system H protein